MRAKAMRKLRSGIGRGLWTMKHLVCDMIASQVVPYYYFPQCLTRIVLSNAYIEHEGHGKRIKVIRITSYVREFNATMKRMTSAMKTIVGMCSVVGTSLLLYCIH